MKFSDLVGLRIVIWGFGREGKAVADHLVKLGISFDVAVPDVPRGQEPRVLYGSVGRDVLRRAQVVIKSPGIPITSPIYNELVREGVRITSLTDLWMNSNARRTVAVTGTKGKSTTAALLAHILAMAGRDVSLRGNIGTSVLSEPTPPSEIVVMELSSYQAQSLSVSPRVVVVTSLFPEHLTWHGSAEAYYRDKLNAVVYDPELVAVPGANGFLLKKIRELSPHAPIAATGGDTVTVNESGDLVWRDGQRLLSSCIPLRGHHQAENASVAALASECLGVTPETIANAIRTFTPLPHRMEIIPSTDGRTWIDDSLATAPEAVVASLLALSNDQVVAVLVGGEDRGLDFTPLSEYLADHRHVSALLSGPVGERIYSEAGLGRLFSSFVEAAAWAWSSENPAGTVLLAPGAPSFNEFASYEQRSSAFRQAAMTNYTRS